MLDVVWLAWRSLRFHWKRSALLGLALAIVLGLPLVAARLNAHYTAQLGARAADVPLLLTQPGDTVDRVLAALYLRPSALAPVPLGAAMALRETAEVIPIHVRGTAQGHPVVGTSPEYYTLRGLRAAQGTPPLRLGEATIGAGVAAALGLGVGDALLTDTQQSLDLGGAYPTRLRVVGVWAPQPGPENDAVFISLGTAWIVDGLAHGHRPPAKPGAMKPGTPTYQEVTPDNAHTFHLHHAEAALPITAAIVRPISAKAETILAARHARGPTRLVRPAGVVDDVLGLVAKVRRFLDRQFALIGVAALLMLAVVIGLDLRLGAPRREALRRLGCGRGRVVAIVGGAWVMLLLLAVVLAAVAWAVAPWIAPQLWGLS